MTTLIEFLSRQLDYLHFLSGLAFIILAVTAYLLTKIRYRNLEWCWLLFFGITYGINNWLDLFLRSTGYINLDILLHIELFLVLLSIAFLYEFARRGIKNNENIIKRIAPWIHLLILMVFLIGLTNATSIYLEALRFLLGLMAGLGAAWTIYKVTEQPLEHKEQERTNKYLKLATFLLILMSLTISFSCNESNQHYHWPIEVFRTIITVLFSLSIWISRHLFFTANADGGKEDHKKYFLLAVLTVTFVLTIGWLWTDMTGREEEENLKIDLMNRATTIAATIDYNKFNTLTATTADYENDEFLQLEKKLQNIIFVNEDIRFIYLMRLVGDSLVFLVDAEPRDSEDYSAPGDIYEEASYAQKAIFEDGQPFFDGPINDQFGEWFYSTAPIQDNTGQVIATLGIDMDVENWQESIKKQRLGTILIVLFLTLLLISYFVLIYMTKESAMRFVASERRFMTIFENAPEAIYLIDPQTLKIHAANSYMQQWLGYDSKDLSKMTLCDLLRIEPKALLEKRPFSIESANHKEQEYYKKDGTKVDVEITSTNFRFNDRNTILFFVRDITERKQEEKKATLLRQIDRQVLEGESLEKILQHLCQQMINLFGYPYVSIQIDSAIHFLAPQASADKSNQLTQQANLQGTAYITEEGLPVYPHELVIPLKVQDNKIGLMYVRGYRKDFFNKAKLQPLEDFTQRISLTLMAAMRQQQLQLQGETLAAAANSIIITNAEGIIQWINPAVTALTGYAKEEVIGQRTNLLKSGQHEPSFYNEMWNTIQEGQVWHGELINRRKDGSLYTEEMTITPVQNEEGQIVHYIAIKQDVTERKLQEAQLVEAKKAAEEGSRAKSEFLANMSHEIRTPLHGIIGMAEILLERSKTAEEKELIEIITDSGHNLLEIVNAILDFSKIEAGKMDIEEVDLEFFPIVKGTVELLLPKASLKNLDLQSKIASDIPQRLKGDPGRLRQVILNLLSNAIKFTETGSVSLEVTILSIDKKQIELQFKVTDTGIGIEEDVRHKLFQPFTQADGSTTRKYGGTGLGLSISKNLVELMGGEIGVEKNIEKGSIFWFNLPLRYAEEAFSEKEQEKQEQEQNEARQESVKSLGFDQIALTDSQAINSVESTPSTAKQTLEAEKKLILLVEDNPVNQRLAIMQLKKLGYEAKAVDNGQEAIDAVQKENYNLILMDCQMPVMDGFEATKIIRKLEDEKINKIPIVAMTAHALEGYREQCISAGMDDYITKPVVLSKLKEIIQGLIN
ncbi:PAS domain S-box protein [Heliorestis acidaminivorans]|uniref:Circadian input-output histidine kinase CikA n=1 Tax=Heliorestis acidaminivorans TaxID=553427 RepID=A0A6I0EXM0_9FIRM|nr:PAS domain S-box protein [Heliorestis acidaminivorans]KAB2951270.1 PAS domain S-box protein [Heliorestis acidaminivorans]